MGASRTFSHEEIVNLVDLLAQVRPYVTGVLPREPAQRDYLIHRIDGLLDLVGTRSGASLREPEPAPGYVLTQEGVRLPPGVNPEEVVKAMKLFWGKVGGE